MQREIHPPFKENVGKRLAYAASKMVYGQTNAPQSPEYSAHTCKDESTLVTFKYVGSGLKTSNTLLEEEVNSQDDVLGFVVLDNKGNYRRAHAQIIAPNQVCLNHPGVSNPKSIRYGWENFPNVNLYGEAEMPVFPFRTDSFSAFNK